MAPMAKAWLPDCGAIRSVVEPLRGGTLGKEARSLGRGLRMALCVWFVLLCSLAALR